MIFRSRTLYVIVCVLCLMASFAFGTFAAVHLFGITHTRSYSEVTTYNSGWIDGQSDIASMLGQRMPTAAEGRQYAACRAAGLSGCHLVWSDRTAEYGIVGHR